MNELKPATAVVNTERVIRELLDAFDSLRSVPAPERAPETPLKAPTSTVSDSAFEGGEHSETPVYGIETTSSQQEIFIEGFCTDHKLVERLRVTPEELQVLNSVSLLGSFNCNQDVLFMLRQIRETTKLENLQATIPSEPLDVPYKRIEASISGIGEIAGRIRRAVLAQPAPSDSSKGPGVFSSALGLMAATTRSCVELTVKLSQRLRPKIASSTPQPELDACRDYSLPRRSSSKVIRRAIEAALSRVDPSMGQYFKTFRPNRAVSAVFEQVKPMQDQLAQIERVLEPMYQISELANVFESLQQFEAMVKDLARVLEPMHIFQNRFRQVRQQSTPPPALSEQLDKLSMSLCQLAGALEASSTLQGRIARLAIAFAPAETLRREFSALAEKFGRSSEAQPS
jgi:hypothetical protein